MAKWVTISLVAGLTKSATGFPAIFMSLIRGLKAPMEVAMESADAEMASAALPSVIAVMALK